MLRRTRWHAIWSRRLTIAWRIAGRWWEWWRLLLIAILRHRWLWSRSTILRRVVAIARNSTLKLLLSEYELSANAWVQVVVLFKLHIARAGLALEDGQADLCRVLILTAELRHRQNALHDLTSDHCLLAQTW